MKITTRLASWGIEIKTDEAITDVYKNGNESNELMQNLIEVLEDLSKMRDESLFDYLENHFDIKIVQKD